MHPLRELRRFTTAERWVHRSTAALMGACLATAAVLYVGPLAVLVGRRSLVAQVHLVAGIALPLPLLLGLLSRAVRHDAHRLGRFLPVDSVWLRARDRRTADLPVGKFNAGQKLNAALSLGAILLMLGTGLTMRYANQWPLTVRTGSTFVHDWVAFFLTVLVLGHVRLALRDPQARAGLRTGAVPVGWALREHRGWAEEELGSGGGAVALDPNRAGRDTEVDQQL